MSAAAEARNIGNKLFYICRSADGEVHFPHEEQVLQCLLYEGYTVTVGWFD